MADKNFQMTQRDATNIGWDNLFPVTKPENVKSTNGVVAAVPHLGTTTNNANVYSITTSEPISVNQKFTTKFNAASTGAATLNVSTIGSAKAIKKPGGTDANLKIGVYTLFYDGTNFQLLGEGGEYGTATEIDVLGGKTIGTENGIVNGAMANHGSFHNSIDTQNGQITIPQGYHNGQGKITATYLRLGPGDYAAWTMAQARGIAALSSMYKIIGVSVTIGVTYRVKFSIAAGSSNSTTYGQIYVNGQPRGVRRSNSDSNNAPVHYSEDITVNAYDTIELWGYSTPYSGSFQSFSICITSMSFTQV